MIIPPYAGQSFASGTRLERVEELSKHGEGGEYAALVKRLDGSTSVWYATLLPGYSAFSWFESIEKAFPHGSADGRSGFVAAKDRLEGPILIIPKGEKVTLTIGEDDGTP